MKMYLTIRTDKFVDRFSSTNAKWEITDKEIVVCQELMVDGKSLGHKETWHYPMENILVYGIEEIDD